MPSLGAPPLGTAATRGETVRVRVPGKVNLHLSVGDARADGYHDIVTVFQAVSLYDEVIARAGHGVSLRLTGAADGVPDDHTNLAWKAAELLAAHAGVAPDVELTVHKEIPVAGGMAGGSADAAGALLACERLWHTGTSRADLAALAGELGADVAFALTGGTALGTGRGEQLTPVLATGEFSWVFALAEGGISAGEAYAELDRLRDGGTAPEPAGGPDHVLDAVRSGDCGQLADALANDLQAAALSLRPALAAVLQAGTDAGALAAVVSGSGPTCAFLCEHAEAAREVAATLEADGVCPSAVMVEGPAHGARIC